MKQHIKTLCKGFAVGGSMVVPGVSGGTMAMLLNIYDQLVEAINDLTKRKFKNLPFLLFFALGGALGVILIAKPLGYLIKVYPKPTLFAFMGAVVGGLPLISRKADVHKFSAKLIIFPLIGIAVVASMHLLPSNLLETATLTGWKSTLLLLVVGILIAAALVLPGISGSFVLLILGLYEQALVAVSDPFHNLGFLIPLGIGGLVGIFLTTGVLEKAMKKFPQETYLIILGFVVGSLAEVWPGFPSGIQIPLSLVLFFATLIAFFNLSKYEA